MDLRPELPTVSGADRTLSIYSEDTKQPRPNTPIQRTIALHDNFSELAIFLRRPELSYAGPLILRSSLHNTARLLSRAKQVEDGRPELNHNTGQHNVPYCTDSKVLDRVAALRNQLSLCACQ